MSNADEEKNREGEQISKNRSSPEDYCRAIAKVAVAQVCEGVRFERVKQSALEALSDIAISYIRDLGKSAKQYAGLAGRSECNVFDIVKGLEDLSSTRGFPCASEVDCCAIDSGALREVIDYVATSEEIPFAQPIPHFPVTKISSVTESFSKKGETPSGSGKHVPDWLPAFPDPHTYQKSPVLNVRQENPKATEEAAQRRKAEGNALLGLHNRLVSSALVGPSNAGNLADDVEDKEALEANPFLAPPFLAGEKEVSQIAVPSSLVSTEGNKKHGPLVETFASAIDAAKSREQDSMDVDKGLSLGRRPVVNFRLTSAKKMLSENVDVGIRNRGNEGRLPVLSINEKRDEKKRRAEQILKQSMRPDDAM